LNTLLSSHDYWVVIVCALSAIACVLPGTYLILNRSSMLGDAISHAVFPGVVVAFFLVENRDPLSMFVGAFISGILAAVCAELISRISHVKEDSALGVVFTTFFSVGVLLVSSAGRYIDIDPSCVLYGSPEYLPFEQVSLLGYLVPQSFISVGLIALFNFTLFILLKKELIASSFDPDFASLTGLKPKLLRILVMISVAATCVATFEAIGAILVVALLIIPSATALILSARINTVVLIAFALGIIAAAGGYAGAVSLDTTVSGMIGVVAFAFFLMALVASPRNSILSNTFHSVVLRCHIYRDDILGMLFRWHEVVSDTVKSPLTRNNLCTALGGGALVQLTVSKLIRRGAIRVSNDNSVRLTEAGLVEGRAVIRSHRLWEGYLARHLGLPLDHLHDPSERAEHYIGRALAREIEAEIGTESDPHGKEIPKG